MALYAFDGTWNKDKPGTESDTNVLEFANAYASGGAVEYLAGVGTRFGPLGKVVGGITGAGGLKRVRGARAALKGHFRAGDAVVDIVGFSRGAALALDFANWVNDRSGELTEDGRPLPIRFLGLWDTVPSFGVPSLPWNIGYHVALPANVATCYHAMALDERRHTFALTRLAAKVENANQAGRLFEVWFRGVHSDVGGGNKNAGLSSISLYWMYQAALRTGLRIDTAALERARDQRRPDARISKHDYDLVKNRFRTVRWNDRVHDSVAARDPKSHNNPPLGLAVVNDDGVALEIGFGGVPAAA